MAPTSGVPLATSGAPAVTSVSCSGSMLVGVFAGRAALFLKGGIRRVTRDGASGMGIELPGCMRGMQVQLLH